MNFISNSKSQYIHLFLLIDGHYLDYEIKNGGNILNTIEKFYFLITSDLIGTNILIKLCFYCFSLTVEPSSTNFWPTWIRPPSTLLPLPEI